MTIEQFYEHLAKKDVDRKEYINRVSLLFFCADLCDTLATEVDDMMKPYGCFNGNLRTHIKKCKQSASAMVKHSDISLDPARQEEFMNDAEELKRIAFKWAGLDN